jgi:hypothetical protein
MQQKIAVTQLLVFPRTGSGQPTPLPVTGIADAGLASSEFLLQGNVTPAGVVIDFGDPGGSDLGGFQTLYHVNSAGQATPYNHVAAAAINPGPTTIFGDVGGLAANRAGTEIVFNAYSRGGICGGTDPAQVLDTATGAVTTPRTPAGGGLSGWWVQGMWFDQTGTAYASLIPNESTCATTGAAPTAGLSPAGYKPIVCKLVDGSWVKTGSGVFKASYGPGNWLAQATGTTGTALGGNRMTLTLSGGKAPVTVPGASDFAWAPSHGPVHGA